MAVSVQPIDGLIHRLLQQNSKPSTMQSGHEPATRPDSDDRVSISSGAEHSSLASEAQEHPQQKPGERALESHLLNLYRMNDRSGG